MPGAAIGALLGLAFSSTAIGVGLAGFLGVSVGTLWLVGASIGSLFDAPSIDLGGSTPNYAFGQLSNTKSQLLPIPIVYGRCRVGGNVFMQTFYDDSLQKMDMFVGVSEGPVQSIKSVYANDVVLIDENGDVVHELADSSINLHLGAPDQVADSREPTGSTYPNTAYIALTLKAQDGLSGNPVISSIVEGRKVWTPSGTVFSRNPAWIVYDFLTNTRYGVGIPTKHIDLDSFTAAATYCDAPIDGEPRFTLDYIIDTQRPAVDHLQAMLGCFRGYFLARDKIELHVEQTGSVYKELTEDNFVKGTFSWWQKSSDDSPNRIVIEWIDPNNHYEQSSAPFEWTEDIAARGVYEKSISLLGVTRPEQVGRLGNYLLETAKRVQNFCAFQVSLQDADIEAGEIISLTYQDFTGWSAKPFRVLAVQDEGQTGNVTITCAEYDATVYGDDALPVQTPIVDPTPVTYDDVYSLALEDVGYIADDGTWFPVIRATWQNPSDYTPAALNIRWRYSGDTVWNLHLNTSRLTTQTNITGLTTGEDLEVWVNCVKPNNGGETTGVTATLSVGRDVTPPAAPTSLTATGWFGNINLEWVNPADKDLNHIEVWENAIDNRDTAVKIAETKGNTYQRYVGSFITRYYWVRAVDLSGNVGAWNATAGTAGNSDQENHQDFVDLLLEENPYLNEAIDDLNTRIDPIETNLDNLLDVTLPEIVNVTLPNITGRLETVEVDLPGAVQRLAERMKEIDADVMDQLRSVSSSAVDALLNIAEIGQRITDAGIVVDPDNGEVRIWAVDQLRTEHGVRLSSAENLISATEAKITNKVWLADVDARIAEAVFGEPGELLVSGLQAQINTVEQELNAAKAELTQKATAIEVDEIGGRVGTAETKISGLEASVALKATQIEVDELDSRITTAEITVDALNGTIGSEIVAIGQEGRDLANLTAEGLVEAILNDSENHDRTKVQLATAKTEIYARVEEGLSAEAGQRTALAATVAGNTAAIIAEATTRSDQDSALAQSITALQAETEADIGTVTAAIQTESTARTNADGALAGQITALETTVSTQDTTLRGLITAEASARSTADGVIVGQVSALEATVEGNDTAVRGLIVTESEARADEDEALAGQITTLAATVGGNTAAIQTESQVRSDADAALAGQITTLQSTVGANSGAIQTEAETRADADTALARFSRNMQAVVEPVAEGLVEDVLNQADGRKKAVEQYAAIREDYEVKIEAGISSEASKRELLAVKLGEAEAAILTESVTRASADNALASNVSTLQTTVGDNTAAIQTVNESVDGIKAKHGVYIDTKGYVTGYELIGGDGEGGSMIFRVDKFLIGQPGTETDYPFALGTVTGDDGVPVTRLSLKNAWIQDLSVDTIKIKNNAVTAYAFINGGKSSNWYTLYGNVSRWYPVPINPKLAITEILSGKPTMVTLAVNWYSAESYGGTWFRVIASKTNYAITNNYKTTSVIDTLINSGTTIFNKNCGAVGESATSYTEQFQWNPDSDGTWYLYVLWQPAEGGGSAKYGIYMNSHSVSVIHMKR